ncbi:acyl-coenzyme A thioesterase 9, mitochondrial-like isoform X2 [Anneissia japonica]|uniref:acyl-coenzyme A thioesterase 9, mitochondrial-like isoform X2 n=1 Tax=Anneissia japonica TaxID=1529436 RepID=UPI0014259F0D|nr:acyl-coenzyme A thioesterase 9, mitochondrial-like isoform X2 [Anneissia japonica]
MMSPIKSFLMLARYRSAFCQFRKNVRCCSTLQNLTSIKELRGRLHDLAGAQKAWGTVSDRSELFNHLPKDQSSLEVKSMKDSYQEACIPLASKSFLREKYVNFSNTIRIGRILEDLDTFAVWISYQHNKRTGEKQSPLVIVTALVDRIDLDSTEMSADHDIKMTGNVTWTGRTSMQVSMNLMQVQGGVMRNKLNAVFLMVARDPANKGSAFVNPVKAETSEEEVILMEGKAVTQKRKEQSQQSLLKVAPSNEESTLIHQLFSNSLSKQTVSFSIREKPENTVWMEDAKLKNIIICFPEQRNLYNKIFGGYLMRKAIEIAFAVALVHSQSKVIFRCIDNITFQRPVEVGSLLYLSSRVTYTEGEFMQVRVHAEVMTPETGELHTTNSFNFTLASKSVVKPVIPKTYGEFMLYLDGRRHFQEFKDS